MTLTWLLIDLRSRWLRFQIWMLEMAMNRETDAAMLAVYRHELRLLRDALRRLLR